MHGSCIIDVNNLQNGEGLFYMIFIQYKTSTPSINYAGICKSCFLV